MNLEHVLEGAPFIEPITPEEFDVEKIRIDFPALHQKIYDKPLVYLDNAATTQKPLSVINVIQTYYVCSNANVHRGIHFLSERATRTYEYARSKVQRFLNAQESFEIIFVRGTTEAINLVAQSYGRTFLKAGDEIIISAIEHHSNIVPWQLVAEQTGARIRVIPVTDSGELILEEYENLLSEKTKIVAVGHVSNALGTVNPIKQIIRMAHDFGAVTLVDGAQSMPHMKVDVQDLDCDFYAFSGHKIYGPTGIGILYGKQALLDRMPPYQGGGEMIREVSFDRTTYADLPHKFEAGTPHIAGSVALGAAIDYITHLGLGNIAAYEHELLHKATEKVRSIPGLRLIGTAKEKSAILSFVMEGVHPHDIGTILDREGIAVRVGHHCAQPAMKRFGLPATARASFSFYNTEHEIDRLTAGLRKVKEVLAL
ncbi:cysteine desulfurase [bacterium]|nr:cysteine desulfurase [bacterium]MCI0603488.1 cysteine desulfurase [bacterium]